MTLPFTVAEMFAVEVDEAVLNASQTCSAASTTFCTLSWLPVAFLAAFAGAFLAVVFFVAAFFAGTFLAGAFLATAFFGAAFLAVVFLGVGLLFAMLDRLVDMIP